MNSRLSLHEILLLLLESPFYLRLSTPERFCLVSDLLSLYGIKHHGAKIHKRCQRDTTQQLRCIP